MKRNPRFVWEGRELLSSALVRHVPFPSNIPVHSCSHGDFPEFSIEKLITKFHFIYNIHVHFVVVHAELSIYHLSDQLDFKL